MPPATIPGYGLAAPTHDSIIESFAKYVPPAEANRLWTAACATAGVRRHGPPPSPEDLRRACAIVIAQGGMMGICANSINVRLISYAMLSKKPQLAGVPAGR